MFQKWADMFEWRELACRRHVEHDIGVARIQALECAHRHPIGLQLCDEGLRALSTTWEVAHRGIICIAESETRRDNVFQKWADMFEWRELACRRHVENEMLAAKAVERVKLKAGLRAQSAFVDFFYCTS